MKKLILLICLLTLNLYAIQKITAVMPANFPPYYIVDKNGKPDGFAVELLNNVAKEVDIEVEYIIKNNFNIVNEYFISKEADVMPNSGISENRKKSSIFTSPTDTFKIVAFKRSSEPLNDTDEIKNKIVAVVKGNVGFQLMKNHPANLLVIKQSNKEALFSLLSGEVDVFIYPEIPIVNILKKLDLEDKVKSFGKPLKEIKRAIRVQKDNPQLLKQLDLGLKRLKDNGKYEKIYTKWFSQDKTVEIKQKDLDRIVLLIAAILILLFLFILFLIRNIQLKRSVLSLKEKFQNMFNEHDSIMLLVDPKSRKIVDANHSASRFYGYNRKELIGLNINKINLLNDSEIKIMANNAINSLENRFEFLHRLKDGTIKTVEVHSTPIEIEKGKVLFSIIEDISEKKEFEKQIITQKEEYKQLLESSSDGVFIMDLEGNLLEFSNRACEMLGYTKEEMSKLNVMDWESKYSKEETLKYFNSFEHNKTMEVESLHKRKDGSTYETYITASKIKLDDKEVIYSSVRDVSKLNKLKKELLDQKTEFEMIFKYSQDGIAVLDLESKFLKFNDAYLKMTGFTKEELLTKSCIELSAPEDIQRAMNALDHVLEHGYINNFEKTCIVKNNKRIKVTISITMLPERESFLMVTKDTTALKLMEEQSRLASMGEMIGNIAHQWRQPLSTITTNASGAKLQFDMENLTKDNMDTYMNSIIKQATYLSETIDNFRDFIKGEKYYGQISLNKVLESAIELSTASLKNNFIKLEYEQEKDIFIVGSDNELIEAILNIINNSKDALKANQKDEGERFIFITLKSISNKEVELKILDNAGGIDETIIDKIFEPYFTTKHKSQGTGLGLAMVNKIIRERHDASIDLYNEIFEYNSKSYRGACFTLRFNKQKEQRVLNENI